MGILVGNRGLIDMPTWNFAGVRKQNEARDSAERAYGKATISPRSPTRPGAPCLNRSYAEAEGPPITVSACRHARFG
jgi:hypothetical protein